jgi:hypothetical protein
MAGKSDERELMLGILTTKGTKGAKGKTSTTNNANGQSK